MLAPMIDTKNPREVAREALRELALRKLPPTPANYQLCYNEVAGLPNVAGFPETQLRRIAAALPAATTEGREHLQNLQAAIGRRSWQGVEEALVALSTSQPNHSTAIGTSQEPVQGCEPSVPESHTTLLARVTRLVENLLPALGNDDQWLSGQAIKLLESLKSPATDSGELLNLLASFNQRVSLAAEEQCEIKQTLLKLLQLIIENIGELSLDRECVQGQIDSLARAVLPPLTLRRLDDVERRLQDVLARQRDARERSLEAQEAMRQMLASFIDHLASINQSNTDFQNDLEQSAREIEQVRTIEDLTPLLQRVIDATRGMAEHTASVREELVDLQDRVHATESEMIRLHEELRNASASARHDPLTDILNRRGLDEALAREIASVRRKDAPLCLSVLDVDNFKQINDRLGHSTGDAALIHLVNTVRDHMRPIDTLARYGGEEFVILMPDTLLGEGVETMKRLQRELTRNFFLADNERLLITFSAGVAQLNPDESGEDTIRRADQAMYLAKRSGKNRVMGV